MNGIAIIGDSPEVVQHIYDGAKFTPEFTPKIIDLEYHNHPLFPVLMGAIEQATKGKGTRHGGDKTPFMEQPWKHYAELHGRGFLTGQAAKKLEEAASIKSGEAFIQEALGAIIYIAMAIINEEESNKNDKNLG